MPNYSIGSDYHSIEETLSCEFIYSFKPVFICKKTQRLPIIFSYEDKKIDHALWGNKSGKSTIQVFPWARSEGIIKNLHSRTLIRNNRCLVPANGFFIRNLNKTYFIYFPKDKIITFGAIWKIQQNEDNINQFITFSIISCPANGKISKLTHRIPLVIHPSDRRKFLKKEKPLMEITRILKKDLKLDFNGLSVNSELFLKKNISKMDFTTGEKLYAAKKFPEKAILGSYYYYQS